MPAIPANAVRQVVGLQRAADKRLLAHDIEMVGRRVKDDLFENVVFIFTKSALDVGKPLYNDFIANCKSLFTGEGGALAGASDADVMSYMKILWNEMTSMRSYFGWFTQKRSNKLQAIENGFHNWLEACHKAGQKFPSIETLEQKWRHPKTYFLFYKYIITSIVGDKELQKRMDEGKTIVSPNLAAFALTVCKNGYFAFIYAFRVKFPEANVQLEYDAPTQEGAGSTPQAAEDDFPLSSQLYDGNLTAIEVSIPTLGQEEQGEFKILTDEEEEEYQEARARDEATLEGAQSRVRQQGQGESDWSPRMAKMKEALEDDDLHLADQKAVSDLKRKARSAMTPFTSAKKKSKKDVDEVLGWTSVGKQYYMEQVADENSDAISGIRKKWDGLYKQLSTMTASGEDAVIGEDEDGAEVPFHVNETLLFAGLTASAGV